MIKDIKYKGLRRFFHSGGVDTRGINPQHKKRLRSLLVSLDTATTVSDMAVPSWQLHPLTGQERGRYSVKVSANWRLTFEFVDGNVCAVDYEDYH